MKVRTGFVSNSSTSSFVCDICGEDVHGWDLCLSEAEMFECENGHIMCNEHALKELTCEGKTEYDEDNDFDIYEIDQECCPICNYQDISYYDAKNYLKKKYGISEEEVFEEIKKVNKRRKKLYDKEYVYHVFKEKNLNDASFLEAIKKEFPSYKDYINWSE